MIFADTVTTTNDDPMLPSSPEVEPGPSCHGRAIPEYLGRAPEGSGSGSHTGSGSQSGRGLQPLAPDGTAQSSGSCGPQPLAHATQTSGSDGPQPLAPSAQSSDSDESSRAFWQHIEDLADGEEAGQPVAAPGPSALVVKRLGCPKCYRSVRGCAQCKKPTYRPRGPRKKPAGPAGV